MEKVSKDEKPGFLLHICCAPCSPHPIKLLKRDYNLTLYFYNPNIHLESEYAFRLGEAEKLAKIENLHLVTGKYDARRWLEMTREYKDEPERGKRCELCIGDRLTETARLAAWMNIKDFGTVLTVSPQKDALMINRLGGKAGSELEHDGMPVKYFDADFKKKDGFKISSRISKELGFKRQNYCGCIYSRFDASSGGRPAVPAGHA
jgi:predicted adenine nucleotide alpha hydrolase (AANH) superfamily ATPase